MSSWFWLAILTALSLSACDALSKVALRDGAPRVLVLTRFLGAVPPMWALWWMQPEIHVEWGLAVILLVATPLEIWALKLYVEALELSDLSLVIPLLALTPVLLVPVGGLLTDQRLGPSAVVGIVLVAVGAYLLNVGELATRGLTGPLAALREDPGARRMLGVAVIYAFTSSLGKRGLDHADPISFGAIYFSFVSLVAAVVWRRRFGDVVRRFRIRPVLLTLVALTSAAMIALHYSSLELADVAAMIAVKRLSLVFSVVIGAVVFREEQGWARFFASLMMVAGAAWLYAVV